MNYTEHFDDRLKDIDIYEKYKVLLPFVGINYSTSPIRILFIGESHYLPKESYDKDLNIKSWYSKNMEYHKFNNKEESYLNTRNIIGRNVINSGTKNKSHSIFRNLGNEYANRFNLLDYNDALTHVSFYNYFLRPAESRGGSINNIEADNIKSYNHLLLINKILEPNAIIFASKKARSAFHEVRIELEENKTDGLDLEKKIYDVPHPGCKWWNKEFKIKKNHSWNSNISFTDEIKINGRNKLKLILESI